MFAGRGDCLISTRRCIPFTLAKLRKAKSVKFIGVFINSFICMGGTGWDGDKCAGRNSHTIGKCERTQCETGHGNWEKVGEQINISYLGTDEEIQRTDGEAISSEGLPQETVDLVHLVYSGFRPTFFCDHGVDLLAKGFNIFGMRKSTIQ